MDAVSQISGFLHMGGYAAYVWSAYGLSFVVLAVTAWFCMRRETRFFEELSRRAREQTGS